MLAVHRLRQGLVEERTALANRLRGLLTEYGVVVGVGLDRLRRALPEILEDGANGIPGIAREVFADAGQQLRELDARIAAYDRRIAALARASAPVQRLMKIEGVGPVTATAVVASVGDAKVFHNGRQFAAWLGLTPRQHSTGGKQRLGAMTKHGDVYLRTLLIHGARAVLRVTPQAQRCQEPLGGKPAPTPPGQRRRGRPRREARAHHLGAARPRTGLPTRGLRQRSSRQEIATMQR